MSRASTLLLALLVLNTLLGVLCLVVSRGQRGSRFWGSRDSVRRSWRCTCACRLLRTASSCRDACVLLVCSVAGSSAIVKEPEYGLTSALLV
jgi:hypothetical protein